VRRLTTLSWDCKGIAIKGDVRAGGPGSPGVSLTCCDRLHHATKRLLSQKGVLHSAMSTMSTVGILSVVVAASVCECAAWQGRPKPVIECAAWQGRPKPVMAMWLNTLHIPDDGELQVPQARHWCMLRCCPMSEVLHVRRGSRPCFMIPCAGCRGTSMAPRRAECHQMCESVLSAGRWQMQQLQSR